MEAHDQVVYELEAHRTGECTGENRTDGPSAPLTTLGTRELGSRKGGGWRTRIRMVGLPPKCRGPQRGPAAAAAARGQRPPGPGLELAGLCLPAGRPKRRVRARVCPQGLPGRRLTIKGDAGPGRATAMLPRAHGRDQPAPSGHRRASSCRRTGPKVAGRRRRPACETHPMLYTGAASSGAGGLQSSDQHNTLPWDKTSTSTRAQGMPAGQPRIPSAPTMYSV